MFNGCSSLKRLDLSNFNTARVGYIGSMFSNCTSLEYLDISGFDTSSVTYYNNMFDSENSSLAYVVLGPAYFNNSSIPVPVSASGNWYDENGNIVEISSANVEMGIYDYFSAPPQPGDVNLDGTVDKVDATLLLRNIAEIDKEAYIDYFADVNKDNAVDILDVKSIIEKITV